MINTLPRHIILLPLLVALAGFTGCGFEPIHATGKPGSESVGAVAAHMREMEIQPLRERYGQIFFTRLNTRIPGNRERLYRLETKVTVGKGGSIIAQDASVTRFEILMNGQFRLINKQNGKELYSKSLQTRASYASPRDPFAQSAAEKDAERRAATALADKLYEHLSLFFERALTKKAQGQ